MGDSEVDVPVCGVLVTGLRRVGHLRREQWAVTVVDNHEAVMHGREQLGSLDALSAPGEMFGGFGLSSKRLKHSESIII